MLLVGYCMGIRSERRLCEEVHLNLAYRWFCRLGLDGKVPDHSTFSKNRHGRLRESNVLRHLFETVVERCMAEGLVGADGFAVDASLPRTPTSSARCQATSAHLWFHNFSAIVGQFDKVALFPPSRIATIGSSCEHGQN